jgi:signal transduction histidine kinase
MKSTRQIDELKAALEGEEKERKRIAKELHDGTGSLLAAAIHNLQAHAQEQILPQQSKTYPKAMELIKEINTEVRRSAYNLMPDILLKNSLEDAVYLFCSYMKQNTGLAITVQTRGDFDGLNVQFKLSLYRIIQELIQNIIKHSKATSAFVQLQRINNLLTITVEDKGQGFDTEKGAKGLGLNSIEDRVNAFNGKISILSNKNKGTSVYIEFELEKNNTFE